MYMYTGEATRETHREKVQQQQPFFAGGDAEASLSRTPQKAAVAAGEREEGNKIRSCEI